MPTLESNLWCTLRRYLPDSAHAVRVENTAQEGTPDVNLQMPLRSPKAEGWGGWIELKVQQAPVRDKTLLVCKHFTYAQRQWLVERCRAGGRGYILLQITRGAPQNTYLFIRGDVAAVWIGQCTTEELVKKSAWSGQKMVDFVQYLSTVDLF